MLKRFMCKIGWHSPRHLWEFIEADDVNTKCRCPWCGYIGMIDSQGNLF